MCLFYSFFTLKDLDTMKMAETKVIPSLQLLFLAYKSSLETDKVRVKVHNKES